MKRLVDVSRRTCRTGAILLVVAALLATAGCGSSDSNTDAVTITKAELIKKGDAICRKTDQIQKSAMNAYSKKHGIEMVTTEGQEKAVLKKALPPIGTEIEELTALGAPEGDEAKVAQIIKELEGALKAAERNPSTVMSTGEGPFTQPDKLTSQYGFKDCAKAL